MIMIIIIMITDNDNHNHNNNHNNGNWIAPKMLLPQWKGGGWEGLANSNPVNLCLWDFLKSVMKKIYNILGDFLRLFL